MGDDINDTLKQDAPALKTFFSSPNEASTLGGVQEEVPVCLLTDGHVTLARCFDIHSERIPSMYMEHVLTSHHFTLLLSL